MFTSDSVDLRENDSLRVFVVVVLVKSLYWKGTLLVQKGGCMKCVSGVVYQSIWVFLFLGVSIKLSPSCYLVWFHPITQSRLPGHANTTAIINWSNHCTRSNNYWPRTDGVSMQGFPELLHHIRQPVLCSSWDWPHDFAGCSHTLVGAAWLSVTC